MAAAPAARGRGFEWDGKAERGARQRDRRRSAAKFSQELYTPLWVRLGNSSEGGIGGKHTNSRGRAADVGSAAHDAQRTSSHNALGRGRILRYALSGLNDSHGRDHGGSDRSGARAAAPHAGSPRCGARSASRRSISIAVRMRRNHHAPDARSAPRSQPARRTWPERRKLWSHPRLRRRRDLVGVDPVKSTTLHWRGFI